MDNDLHYLFIFCGGGKKNQNAPILMKLSSLLCYFWKKWCSWKLGSSTRLLRKKRHHLQIFESRRAKIIPLRAQGLKLTIAQATCHTR